VSAIPFRGSGATSFDSLYRRHSGSVYRYALAVLGNSADAEDVTQTTFLNAYRALAQGVKPRKPENWLITIAHNQVRQHFRSAQARPVQVELMEADHSASVPEPDGPTVADVLRALQKLAPSQREALVMREFEGRSYAEMAEIMGLSSSALEALIFRARKALAAELEEAYSCSEAELALLRGLDGRLPRRDARKLRAHLAECPQCSRFQASQSKQRRLLKGLSIVPIPASLVLLRGQNASAAVVGAGGAAASGAAVGGGASAGGGVLAGVGLAGVAAKVAVVTVTAAAAVSAGVGYHEVASKGAPPQPQKPLPVRAQQAHAAKGTHGLAPTKDRGAMQAAAARAAVRGRSVTRPDATPHRVGTTAIRPAKTKSHLPAAIHNGAKQQKAPVKLQAHGSPLQRTPKAKQSARMPPPTSRGQTARTAPETAKSTNAPQSTRASGPQSDTAIADASARSHAKPR